MGFLRRVHDATLGHKVHSCKIRKALNVEPLARKGRSQPRWLGYVSRMPQQRLARGVLLAKPTGKRLRCRPRTRWSDYISDLAWPSFGVEPTELYEIADSREVFRVLLGLVLPGSPQRKNA